MWSKLVVVALALGNAQAFAPGSRVAGRIPKTLSRVLESEASVVDTSTLEAAYVQSTPFGDASPKVSKFKARARELWDKDANYGRYNGLEESEAYSIIKNSPLGQVDLLRPLIERTRARPEGLDGTYAGDYGFDPLGYASSEELTYFYLESEVKHGRLAMVGTAGWVGAELAKGAHLASGGRCPSILNGHLFDWQNFFPLLAIFGAWSVLEHKVYPSQYIEHTPNNGKHNYQHYMDGPYVAGNWEFDPLNLYSSLGDTASGRRGMRELEVQHGRAAMMGITSWVLFEALTKASITDTFSVVFKPFWKWGLPFLGENAFVGTVEFAGLAAGLGYLAYKEVMEIDSMKYQGDGDPDFTFFEEK